jgi:hypothetical protein
MVKIMESSSSSAKLPYLSHNLPSKIKNFFLICIVGGGIKVHSTLRPLNGLLCQPRVIMIMEKPWNDWQGKPKYSEKTCPSAALSTTNPTCCPYANPGRRGGSSFEDSARFVSWIGPFGVHFFGFRNSNLFAGQGCLPCVRPSTRRARSLYLCPPVTESPSYTPRHRVPFSSLSTTRRATVEVL